MEVQLEKMCGNWSISPQGPRSAGLGLGVALGNSGQEGGTTNSKDHSEVAKGRVENEAYGCEGHLLEVRGLLKPPLKMDL